MRFGKIRTMKKIFLSIILMLAASSLFAVEEYVSLIYKQIDEAFTARSADTLDQILKDNINDKYYYLIENYTQKKIRRLILTNDYQFAQDTTLVVIDNNLDNTDAVEMYSLILDAYEIQKDAEAKAEQARLAEAERVEKEKEKARSSTEKLYEGVTTASGQSIYLSSEKDLASTRYEWKAQAGLFNLEAMTAELGFSVAGSYDYNFRDYTVGADLFTGISCIRFDTEEPPIALTIEAIPRISLTRISRKGFLRAGFMCYRVQEESTLNFFTPVIGIQINQIKIGRMRLSAGFDWYPAHIWNSDFNFAAGINGNMEIPFTEYDRTDWYFIAGIKDKLFVQESPNFQKDNKLYLILGIGAKNVVR